MGEPSLALVVIQTLGVDLEREDDNGGQKNDGGIDCKHKQKAAVVILGLLCLFHVRVNSCEMYFADAGAMKTSRGRTMLVIHMSSGLAAQRVVVAAALGFKIPTGFAALT